MKTYLFLLFLFLATNPGWSQETVFAPYAYSIAPELWAEEAGNHRAVLEIKQPAEAVFLEFEWRRPNPNTADHEFRIVHAQTGKSVSNIQRIEVNNERCKLVFGPVDDAGIYLFYYLPYQVQPGHGWYSRGYYPPENPPSESWTQKLPDPATLPRVKVTEVQSRTLADSFYPMEIAATQQETENYQAKYPSAFWLFPEDRKYPIRMKQQLPFKWLTQVPGSTFQGNALQNEYYTFQIGVVSGQTDLENLRVSWTAFIHGKDTLPVHTVTCFNTEGINPQGKYFRKQISVPAKNIQPLWFGVDLPMDCPAGTYKGRIDVASGNTSLSVPVAITVHPQTIAERGDNDLWRMSRLRWLNSTAGIDDLPVDPYVPLQIKKKKSDAWVDL